MVVDIIREKIRLRDILLLYIAYSNILFSNNLNCNFVYNLY